MSTKYNIYITRNIPKEAISILEKDCTIQQWQHFEHPVEHSELLKHVENIDGLFCLLTDNIDKEVLDKAKKLKVISTMSVGYDHINIEECKKRHIKVGNTPNVSTDSVADLSVTLLLAVSRRLVEACNAVRNGEWGTWSPMWMCGTTLQESTVGFFGFGRIANGIGRRLIPFGVKEIILNDNYLDKSKIEAPFKHVDFDTLISKSDFLFIACALTDETHHLFNKSIFSKMKPNCILINSARGGIINQDDLIWALKEGKIAGAGLDVTTPEPLPTDSELLQLKNCIVLPHVGSAIREARIKMGVLAAENLINGLKGMKMVEI